jgi:hypothetical protein
MAEAERDGVDQAGNCALRSMMASRLPWATVGPVLWLRTVYQRVLEVCLGAWCITISDCVDW